MVILQLLSVAFLAILGGIVWRQRPKDPVHQNFLLFTVALNLWVIGGILSNLALPQALFLNKMVFVFPLVLVWSAMDLSIRLSRRKTRLVPIIGISVIVVSLIILATDAVVVDIIARYVGDKLIRYDIHRGYGYYIYVAYLVSIAAIALITLFVRWRKIRFKERDQLSIVGMGLLACLVSGLSTSVILPVITGSSQAADFSFLSGLVVTVSFAYAIAKYDLFDIKLVAVRSVVYLCALLTMSAVYYVLAYALSILVFGGHTTTTAVSVSPLNIFLALVLAFLFQPIKRFFDRVTNDIFYRRAYKSEDFFASLSDLLSSTADLRVLLVRASEQVASTFKAEQAFFFLRYTNGTSHHMSAGTHGHIRLPLEDAQLLDSYVTETNDSLILTELIDDDRGMKVRRMLQSHRIALVMPLWSKEEILGYTLLGEHLSGNYTKRDLNVLLTISNQLVIAVQNALSLHEVKELNSTLQQRINVATKELRSSNAQLKHLDEVKDEFMSMASHQLRTPLTSVKGYISMVLEGDAGNVSLQQQKLLMEAFKSSERMVGLINDFLNVSRLQTGKFIIEKKLFDLGAVVEQEVSDLQLIARTHGIKLRLNATDHPLPLLADESKVRQVIMNYIDNAIYYSRANGTVVINLEKIGNTAALTVVDTGIGVPKEEQARLFNKFFRAKNARKARPDGTGVGLYLARRVIAAHGGSIIFSSYEGKGSTFGFRMPLSKESADKIEDSQIPKEEPIQLSAAK